jgi:c-di-GMP-binding flagellar brake protein YcgR
MFKLLNKIIGAEESTKAPFRLTNSCEIVALLTQAYNGRTIFSVHLKGHAQLYSTALLGVYAEHGFIVLDELTPKEGHEHLLNNKTLQISGKVEGVVLSFATQLIEAREKSGIPFYKVAIPEFVLYKQQRQEHRISTTGHWIPFHGFETFGAKNSLHGYVSDLSQKGIGLIVEETDVALNRQDVLSNCTVTLPDEEEAPFSLEVRFIQENNSRKITRVGGLFNAIDEGTLRRIVRTKNKLEREQCRRIRKR